MCGGVGLSAIAGMVIAGYTPIIAVDVVRERLELAHRVGATDLIDAAKSDSVQEILNICPGGVDLAAAGAGGAA